LNDPTLTRLAAPEDGRTPLNCYAQTAPRDATLTEWRLDAKTSREKHQTGDQERGRPRPRVYGYDSFDTRTEASALLESALVARCAPALPALAALDLWVAHLLDYCP